MLKTVTLRTLVRDPLKVKRMTRAGARVQVTDKGRPLWVIHPAISESDAERIRETNKILDEVLSEPVCPISAVQILEASRR
jgi:hypothetical protein